MERINGPVDIGSGLLKGPRAFTKEPRGLVCKNQCQSQVKHTAAASWHLECRKGRRNLHPQNVHVVSLTAHSSLVNSRNRARSCSEPRYGNLDTSLCLTAVRAQTLICGLPLRTPSVTPVRQVFSDVASTPSPTSHDSPVAPGSPASIGTAPLATCHPLAQQINARAIAKHQQSVVWPRGAAGSPVPYSHTYILLRNISRV